jgi:hypothetical protein
MANTIAQTADAQQNPSQKLKSYFGPEGTGHGARRCALIFLLGRLLHHHLHV